MHLVTISILTIKYSKCTIVNNSNYYYKRSRKGSVFCCFDLFIVFFYWVANTHPLPPLKRMDSTNINDYLKELESLCPHCRKVEKCKDKTTICMFKRFAFTLAKRKYKKDMKKKGVNNASC